MKIGDIPRSYDAGKISEEGSKDELTTPGKGSSDATSPTDLFEIGAISNDLTKVPPGDDITVSSTPPTDATTVAQVNEHFGNMEAKIDTDGDGTVDLLDQTKEGKNDVNTPNGNK